MIPFDQFKHWAISPNVALIEQSQTNRVAGRFIQTLKEQKTHGRLFQSLEELRATVGGCVGQCNRE
jgi:hypothetical protein